MDPATIAAAVVAILSPYAKSAGEELVKAVGAVALDKAKSLIGWLRERFSDDPVAAKDLSRFEAQPDKFEAGLEATLKEMAERDPAFAQELQRRLDDIGPVISVFQDIKDGRNVTGLEADEIRSGTLSVTQHAERVDGLTGVRVRIIGTQR